MNVYSITFQTVLNALRHQWKRILAFVLLFALLGAAVGFFFRSRGMAEAGGGAQPLVQVDFAQTVRTQDYYTGCLRLLTDTIANLNAYVSLLTANATPNLAQQAALDTLSQEVVVLQSSRLRPLQRALEEAGAVYVPEECLDGLAERYVQELENLRMDLIAAEAATETIRQMDAPNYDGNFSGSYTTLMSLAAQYPTLLRSKAVTEKYLDKLTNHMPEVRVECRRMERELEAVCGELNALLDRFTSLADEVAKEAGLSFVPTVQNGKTEILLTHSHRASSAQESFAVIELFCVLVGICFGTFLAVCREAKEEKQRFSGQTEAQSPDAS